MRLFESFPQSGVPQGKRSEAELRNDAKGAFIFVFPKLH